MAQSLLRKRIIREMNEDTLNTPLCGQQVVQVIASRGNFLHEVVGPLDDESFLVSMPRKFRNIQWIRRGNFVVIEPIPEGNKVKGEIVKILTEEHIEAYEEAGVWPEKFARKAKPVEEDVIVDDEDSPEFTVRNPNRPPSYDSESSYETDEGSENDSDESDEDEEDASAKETVSGNKKE